MDLKRLSLRAGSVSILRLVSIPEAPMISGKREFPGDYLEWALPGWARV